MFTSVQDYIALTKPRITLFCVIMTICGVFLVTNHISFFPLLMILSGTALSVGSANAFNMVYEQDIDKLMARTSTRPLAAGRLKSHHATIFAFLLGLSSIIILTIFANIMTALIALSAIIFYTLIYTPLKIKTPLALVIGAVPGAIAPVLGTTAIQNEITPTALIIFAILFTWQMPHFIAISIYSKNDYQRAGFKVISVVRSAYMTRIQAILWTFSLLVVSILPFSLHLAGAIYLVCASLLGLWFFIISLQGIRDIRNNKWPKKFFHVSLMYLPLLALSVIIDRIFALG